MLRGSEKKNFGGIPSSPNVLFLQIFLKRAEKPILLNLTWLCTKIRNPVEPDLALHQSLPDLLRNLLRNPVEPDLALHQSLPDLLRNLLRNPVEPDPPTFSGTFFETLLNLTWLCTKASQTFSGTFSGTLLNLTWLCTKASPTFSGTFSGTLLNVTWLCNLRNFFRNLVEPDPAPAPVHTGAILG